jgi:serine/arginine repetitive matrix protein 2
MLLGPRNGLRYQPPFTRPPVPPPSRVGRLRDLQYRMLPTLVGSLFSFSCAILTTIFCTARRPTKDNSGSSDDSSDDDAPLATLVQPRRPGSALSNSSGRSLPPKPLIDIKSLANSPLSNSPAVSSVTHPPVIRSVTPTNSRSDLRSPTNINERLSNLTQSLARPKATSTVSESTVKAESDSVSSAITERTAPNRSATAPPEVLSSVEKKPLASPVIDKESSPAPNSPTSPTSPDSVAASPSVNTTEFPVFTSPRASLSLDDPTPIKPTPIHHRAPQSGFSVMSRPQHNSTLSISSLTALSSAQKKEGEPLDSIGDFTAAMFSQLDLGFSSDEGRKSLDSTIKGAVATAVAKSTGPTSPAPEQTAQIVDPTAKAKKKGATDPTRPASHDAPPSRPRTSESMTSGRLVGQPRSPKLTTSVPSQPSQPSNDQPQPQPIPRSQPPKPVKGVALDVSGSRKGATTSQIRPPPPISRHKRAPSTTSTSSESSSESSSSAPSIAPRKQKQPQSQPRPRQPPSRPRSATMGTLVTANLPPPTNPSTNTSSSPAFNRPPQRPFAMRDNSPSSSTGDSSSGRLPITPRDGSEIGRGLGRGVRGKQQLFRTTESFDVGNDGLLSASNSEMGLKAKKLAHRKSASYDDSTLKAVMRGGNGVPSITDEDRRRERRRSEAKNAIEV